MVIYSIKDNKERERDRDRDRDRERQGGRERRNCFAALIYPDKLC